MASAAIPIEEVFAAQEKSQRAVVWRRFSRHKLAMLGLGTLIFLFVFSFVGPYIVTNEPDKPFLGPPMGPLTAEFPLGTDELGRDVLVRMMWAGRISLTLSILVVFGSTLLGILAGVTSGYFGGKYDTGIMRFVDFMLTLPILPLLLILSAMNLRGGLPVIVPPFLSEGFGLLWGMSVERAENILILVAILILFQWMTTARLVRGQILSLRNSEFSEAARALGGSSWRIITKHMIPNALAPIIIAVTLAFGEIIILEAALSFLGFGVQPPSASWGNMLNNVRDFMLIQPWRALVPGMAIFLASISFNFVGDALRDALDPRLKL